MPEEPIELIGPSGEHAAGAAEIVRYSPAGRIAAAAGFIIAGLIGGAACIVIPILHLITTWALPLGGVLLGMRAYKRRVMLYELKGTCPVCKQRIELGGGSIDDPGWQTCPLCQAKLAVSVPGLPLGQAAAADPVG